jgi:hypothetical protein
MRLCIEAERFDRTNSGRKSLFYSPYVCQNSDQNRCQSDVEMEKGRGLDRGRGHIMESRFLIVPISAKRSHPLRVSYDFPVACHSRGRQQWPHRLISPLLQLRTVLSTTRFPEAARPSVPYQWPNCEFSELRLVVRRIVRHRDSDLSSSLLCTKKKQDLA